jgi:hypothetical protein
VLTVPRMLSRVSWNLRWRSPPEARLAVGIG